MARLAPRSAAAAATVALAIALLGTSAHAQAHANADQLFREGRDAMGQHDYEKAITKLEASQKLEPAAGTLLNLADCYQQVKRYASAWETYIQARQAAQKRGRNDWVELATERITALSPKLSKLRLVGRLSPGQRAELDGKPLDVESYGPSLPVDAGAHRIVVFEGQTPRRAIEFVVQPLKTEEVRLENGTPIVAPPSSASTANASSPSPAPKDDTKRFRAEPSPLVWVLGGSALVGAAVGGVLLGVRSVQVSNVTAELEENRCLAGPLGPIAFARCEPIQQKPTMSFAPPTIAFAASGALAVSAVVLYFVSTGSNGPRDAASRLSCVPSLGGGACEVLF